MTASHAPLTRRARIARYLALDTTGGLLLLGATVLALVAANSPLSGTYSAVRDFTFGAESLHLDLSVGAWAADGLLAIFFFVVGLELKHEFVAGSLRDLRVAALPIAAAIGGVAVPALIFTVINLNTGGDALRGWAIPAATDIAFAVAVIAVVGRKLPPAMRTFLLTLAVVDDLLAISIIAVFYSDGISLLPLGIALVPLALFTLLVRRGVRAWYLLIPLGVIVWALVHASGIHATIAGVALGLVVPAIATRRNGVSHGGELVPLTEHFAAKWSPVSSGFAVPVFAFFAAGVAIGGVDGLIASLTDPVALGIIVALVLGKPLGITGTSFLMTRLPGIRIAPDLRWGDMIGMSFVAGIGFTVSLLIGELAFGAESLSGEHVKIGVLLGSLIAAAIGAAILITRSRRLPQPDQRAT